MTSQKRALDKIYKRRDRYEIPEWQREEVWTKAKKRKLIDSILRGWKLPKFYFLKTDSDPEEFEVVDGQQRLLAVFDFFDEELTLADESKDITGDAASYKELPDHLSDRFDDYEIEYDEIEDASEEELKEFFQRLQEGLPLTSSEKLNSVHSKLTDFCRRLAENEFLVEKTSVSPRRYGYFDIVAKVATLEVEGLDVGLRYDDMKVVFEANASFSEKSNVAKRLRNTFDLLNAVFEEKDPRLRNRTIVQSVATFIARVVDAPEVETRAADLGNFLDHFLSELAHQVELGQNATDEDYIAFQKTVNANVKSGPETRQNILVRKMLAYDPSLGDLFDLPTVLGSGINQEIVRLGKAIGEAVTKLNADHSAQHGVDLIKSTNKTTEALLRIGEPIDGLDAYKQLIDDLYFLFHEGPGSRLPDAPSSFADVNTLRTELRHDLDHGKKGAVKKKRKKAGTAFQKYAGSVSPQTLDPERFPAVQAKVLTAILGDLKELEGTQ